MIRSSPDNARIYEENRRYVLRVLARRCAWLADDEREETLQDAFALLLQKQRDGSLDTAAMSDPQIRAYLTQTAINKALDEGKRAGRNRSVPLEDSELSLEDEKRLPDDLAAASLDSARVREIVAELPERRQAIVKLRFYFDRAPAEIQRFLGLSERVYRRELERAMRHLTERYQMVEDGSFCEERRSLIIAYVAGIAGPGRNEAARAHLASCPGCSRMAAELREVARGAAIFVPLPVLFDHPPRGRFFAWLDGVREAVLDTFATAKQQFTGVATRLDSGSAGYLTGTRPGTIVATIAGCVAIGAGGAYCVVEGPPLLRGGADRGSEANTEVPPERAADPAPAGSFTPAPTVIAPRPTAREERPRRSREESRSGLTEREAPAGRETSRREEAVRSEPASEFGFEGSGETVGGTEPPAASISGEGGSGGSAEPAPAPLPPAPPPPPPGEFDP